MGYTPHSRGLFKTPYPLRKIFYCCVVVFKTMRKSFPPCDNVLHQGEHRYTQKYFRMVFENEVGNCNKEELEKFVVLAWPALVPLKHTHTYMRLVKCKHRSLYRMQPDSMRITKLIYTSKTTYIYIVILNGKENGFQCNLIGTRLILTKLCTLERPITPNFDFYCYVSCPIILWDKMQRCLLSNIYR